MADDEHLWQQGTKLDYAWVKFAPNRLRREYHEYEPGDVYGRPPSEIDPQDRAEAIRALSRAPLQILEHLGLVETPVAAEMKAVVLDALIKGRLAAFGLTVKPTPSHNLSPIPISMYQPDFVKWGKSIIEGRGFSYTNVIVLRSKQIVATTPAPNAKTVSEKPKPKSLADQRSKEIIAAFDRLKLEGKIVSPPDKVRTSNLIKKLLSKERPDLFPGGKSLSYQNIYRILNGNPNF